MNTITLKNEYTNETVTLPLISEKFTWQYVWVVIFQGRQETLSNAMGWSKA